MNSKIISEKEHSLLKRKELVILIDHPKAPTPKTEEVTKNIAETTKKEENLISVKKVTNQFGSNTAKVTAHVYESEEARNAIEKINKKKLLEAERKVKQEASEKPTEEVPKEAAPVEKEKSQAPKEAVKEEKPAEEKKEESK